MTMTKRTELTWKIGISAVAIALAALRIVIFKDAEKWFDSTFLLFLSIPFFAFLVPWHRLTAFKAVGVEFTLNSPSVQGAISGIEMSVADNRRLRRTLYNLGDAIEDAKGSRVLWIDDNPSQIVGERRVLRALGVHVASASSSAVAREILNEDNDFDLIITDFQRASEPGSPFENYERYGGVEFVFELRKWSGDGNDVVIRNIPIVVYTAYTDDQVRTIFRQVSAEDLKDLHISHTIAGLLQKVYEILPAARAEAIKVPASKPPTDIRPTNET
jgi:CheY-like chemotaxis protein